MEILLLLAVICLGAGAVLAVLEIFLPSGGALGFGAAIAVVAGIILLFMYDTTVGLAGAIVSVAALPIIVGLGIRYWASTPIARMLTLSSRQRARTRADLQTPLDADPLQGQSEAPDRSDWEAAAKLIGKTGEAITDLRPSGVCRIDGKRIDCVANRGMIDRGAAVRVIVADPLQVVVAVDEPAAEDDEAKAES